MRQKFHNQFHNRILLWVGIGVVVCSVVGAGFIAWRTGKDGRDGMVGKVANQEPIRELGPRQQQEYETAMRTMILPLFSSHAQDVERGIHAADATLLSVQVPGLYRDRHLALFVVMHAYAQRLDAAATGAQREAILIEFQQQRTDVFAPFEQFVSETSSS